MGLQGSKTLLWALAATATVALTFATPAQANVARVEFSVGQVTGVGPDGKERKLYKGSALDAGDTVRTGRGRAQIRFTDGGYTSLQPETEFRIDDYHYDAKREEESVSLFSLLKGGLRTITGAIGKLRKKAYRLTTPVATVGIRGTEYLAVVGNSLTVHVGDGDIEVCTDVECTPFGPHQTGYVASANSVAILSPHPPSLAPPQERQVYAFNGQYQAQFDAAADFSANESQTPLAQGPASGPLYSLAVSWGENATLAELFVTGLLSPPGELTDAQFDGSGALTSYTSNNFGSPITGDSGTTTIVEAAFQGPIGWGRWIQGSATGGAATGGGIPISLTGDSSHHYVVGIPTATMPTGNATYSLIGATSPTLASGGAAGTLNSADLAADFTRGNVTMNMDMTVGGVNYSTSGASMTISDNHFSGGGTTVNSVNCISVGCFTNVEGFFAGNDASHAGVSYKTQIPGDYINGAAAFSKD